MQKFNAASVEILKNSSWFFPPDLQLSNATGTKHTNTWNKPTVINTETQLAQIN